MSPPPRQPTSSARIRAVVALLATLALLAAAPPVPAGPPTKAAAVDAWLALDDATRVPAGWTGSVEGCVVGTESPQSLAATLAAINALRDHAGLAAVSLDPALNRKALATALMMRAANDLSHAPGPSWPCHSAEGAEGAARSNLYLGRSGAAAMIGYVHDDGIESLGHRRWLLNPRAGTFGTGSTGRTNALYVIGTAPAPAPVVPDVVAWPPPGQVAWRLVQGEWSAALNHPGTVDVSGARVRVAIGGRSLPVSGVTNMGAGYGAGPMIKWGVGLTSADRASDATITVVIDGVTVDGAPRQLTYAVQAIRIDRPDPTTYAARRTPVALSVVWAPATEHGVPVTGYRVQAREERSRRQVLDRTVAPTDRSLSVPHSGSDALLVRVIPLSRLGSPQPGAELRVLAPRFATKLEIARAGVKRSARRLDVLAPITARSSGVVGATFRAAGRTTRFTAPVDSARRRVRIDRRLPSSQARKGTGILTLAYAGDADTQPQTVRLRAAASAARLRARRPRIAGGRVTASGTISRRARGVVRLQLLWEPAGQATRTLQYKAQIVRGRYRFDERLPADVVAGIADRDGVVHSYTLFTGYLAVRMRGEMKSFQVLGYR